MALHLIPIGNANLNLLLNDTGVVSVIAQDIPVLLIQFDSYKSLEWIFLTTEKTACIYTDHENLLALL